MNDDSNLSLEEENNKPYANKGKSLLQLPSDYTIFDLETTGLYPDWFEIIEMSAIRIRNNQIVDTYTQLVKPDDEIPPEATAVNHIKNEMVANSPKIKEVLKYFLDFLGDDIVMGHNVNFDIRFVYLNAEKCYGQYFTNNYIDTMRISRRLFKTEKHHRLKDLIERFKLGGEQEHRALSDCQYTKKVFDWMVNYIKENNIDTKELFRIYKKKKTYTKYDFNNLIATEEINEDNPFFGKDVCFTGTLEKYTRNDAAQIIVNCGGHPQNSVNKETDFLIVGDTDFREKTRKMEEAYKKQQKGQDIEIIPESMFYQMLNDNL